MEIKAFKALRYNPDKVGDPGKCVAPPYDVIDDRLRDELYERSEHNVVRIIRGKTTPEDDEQSNQYSRAAEYINDWTQSGALKKDEKDAIYAYVQDFDAGDRRFQRKSFVSLAKLEEFGRIVRPHEETLTGPKADRLKLEKATGAKLGLVFMVYEDPEKIADRIIEQAAAGDALVDFTDDDGVRHRLYGITEAGNTETIVRMMADKSCVIADGHHRYETALKYYRQTGNPSAAYTMAAFVNSCDEGLLVLATHRLVDNLDGFEPAGFIEALDDDFEVTELRFESAGARQQSRAAMLAGMKDAFDQDKKAFGVYCGAGIFYLAVLKNEDAMAGLAEDKSETWKSLDVSVLHKLVLEKILGIGQEELAGQSNVQYVKDTPNAIDESIQAVDMGDKQIALFMNPPRMKQIQMVADAGEKMPQKSTYFYPKMYTGLLINKL